MSRRARIATILAFVVAVLVVVVIIAANLITGRLWFASLGFSGVYDRTLLTKALLYGGFGAAMGVLVAANVAIGVAIRPLYVSAPDLTGLGNARVLLASVHRRFLGLVAVLVGLGAGRIAAEHWQTFLMWRYGGSFGVEDPQFHHDAGFYVFVLPWWHFVADFAMVGLILSLVAAIGVHYLYGGLRLQPTDRHLTRGAGLHLAAIGAAILVVKAVQTWLGRYDVMVRPGSDFSGLSYVGYHAILPGQTLLAWLAVVCAVVLLAAAWRSHWLFSTVAIGLYAIAIVAVGVIWPAVMRSTSVDGRVVAAEKSFAAHSIVATRRAYGLTGVVTATTTASPPTKKQLGGAQPQIEALRTDSQRASVSLGLLSRAEVGYYPLKGQQTELLLGVRRVEGKDLLSAAYATGQPQPVATGPSWWTPEQMAANLGVGSSSLAIDPVQTGYQVVPSAGSGATGGYSLSSWFTRAASAIRYADPSLVSAAGIDRLADVRQPLQRVQQLAPWLTLDPQVYPAVVGGRVQWILDGYTTSAMYPNSQVASLDAMTADSMNPRPTFGSGVDTINYIRDSVKVVVDATTGAVTFYAWDEQDPILNAMRRAFPGMVKPKEAMPGPLAAAMRYPTALFSVQRSMLATYRLTDPAAFLRDTSPWAPAEDPGDTSVMAPAQRGLLADANGMLTPTLSSIYSDASGAITEAYLTVDSDPGSPQFGQLVLHQLPSDPVVVGPTVVARRFAADPRVVALGKTEKSLQPGALLTVSVAGGVLQAQSLYGSSVQPGDALGYVATFGGAIGYGHTLAAAITDIAEPQATTPANASAASVELVRQADGVLADANAALQKGDLTTYEADVAKAKALLEKALLDPAWKAAR